MIYSQWTEKGIELMETEPPALQPGWARLRVQACGICGSDLHGYKTAGHGTAGGRPGHELCGRVVEGAAGLADELYAVEPLITCRSCEFCLAGQPQLCRGWRLVGAQVPGGLAQLIDVPLTNLHASSPALTPLEASITEPFAVCTHAIHLARLKLDSRVLVLGGGTLGLISGVLARDFAVRVGVTCRYPDQAAAARSLGLEPVSEADAEAWAREAGPDAVIETVGGLADTLELAVKLCRPGGRIVVLGLFQVTPGLDMRALVVKELTITGSAFFGIGDHGREFAASAALLPRYRDEINVLQTHQFPLQRIAEAFACAADKHTGAIKVTVLCDA